MSAPAEEPYFRKAAGEPPLPRARPPRWMWRSVAAAFALLFALGAALLVMPFEESVRTTGWLCHGGSVSVFAPRDSFVRSEPPAAGSRVEEGALLLTLADPGLEERRAALEAEMAAARAALAVQEARARKTLAAPLPAEFLFSTFDVDRHTEVTALQEAFLKRLEAIEKSGAASQAEVLNLRLQLVASETLLRRSRLARDLLEGPYGGAARDEARLAVEEARQRLAGLEARKRQLDTAAAALEIRAPLSGTLAAATRRDPGERVAAGEELFEIAPGGVNRIRLLAPAARLHLIRPGMAVRFRAASESDTLAPPGRAVVLSLQRAPLGSPVPGPAASPGQPLEMPVNTMILAEVRSAPSDLLPDVPVTAEITLGSRPFWRLLLMKR